MTVRFDVQHHMPEFLAKLEKLARSKPSLRGKMHAILQRYAEDCGQLNRAPLHNPKRKIWHTDVDDEKRLVDEPLDPARPREIAILYVDHHDAANAFGARYAGDTLRRIEAGEAKRSAADRNGQRTVAKSLTATPERRGKRGTYGELVTASQLTRVGLSDSVVTKLLARHRNAGVEDLGFTEEQLDKVNSLCLAAIPSTPVPLPVPGYDEPQPVRVTLDELPSLLRMPLGKYLARMSEEQVQLATRANRRLYVIRGAAGSGKTVVGIRRMEHLLSQRDLFDDRPLLFTCFNRVLKGAVEQMLMATVGGSLRERRIEVRTIYEVMGDASKRMGLAEQTRKPRSGEMLRIIRELRADDATSGILVRWPDDDILAEIIEIIFGRAIASLDEYLNADRSGRGRARALDERGRTAVWKIYQRFRRRCRDDGMSAWEYLPARLAYHLEMHPPTTPYYAGIVIDEAQDLPPAAVRSLIALQAGRTEDIVILGDAAQNVYRNGFRWKHFGLKVAGGQVTTITRCFRSTKRIIEAAAPMVSNQGERLEDDLVLPEAEADAEAPLVDICTYDHVAQELEQTAIAIVELVTSGVPPSAIAVLLDDSSLRRRLAEQLTAWECPFEELYKPRAVKSIDVFDPSVKLLTTYSAKGLEFQVIFLPHITNGTYPGESDEGEAGAKARRSLYTAMVRCGWELHLSATRDAQSPLLKELGGQVRRRHFEPS